MNFKKGDKVVVISGKSKGTVGTISNILKDNKVIVEGANMVKKHIKPNGQTAGSIVEVEAPINASNVMIILLIKKVIKLELVKSLMNNLINWKEGIYEPPKRKIQ